MTMLVGVALWVIAAPSGYVVGDTAREHSNEDNVWLPWATALCPPAAAVVALALILRAQIK